MTTLLTHLGPPWTGFGDAIRDARYVHLVNRTRCPDPVLVVRPSLLRLFSRLAIPVVALPEGAEVPPGNPWTDHLDRWPAQMSSLTAPLWYSPLGNIVKADFRLPRVGLRMHAGRGIDDVRSLPWAVAHHLQEHMMSASWVSLDDGGLYARFGVTDWADTARVVRHLDLVITVDTAVAHLAATLGVPTWLLLDLRSAQPWLPANPGDLYPTMLVLRQKTPGRWASVLEDMLPLIAGFRIKVSARGLATSS